MIISLKQQQAIHDRSRRLIVSAGAHTLRMDLTLIVPSRTTVRPSRACVSHVVLTCCLAAELELLERCKPVLTAGYEHGDCRGCLAGTRGTTLDEVEAWTNDRHRRGNRRITPSFASTDSLGRGNPPSLKRSQNGCSPSHYLELPSFAQELSRIAAISPSTKSPGSDQLSWLSSGTTQASRFSDRSRNRCES